MQTMQGRVLAMRYALSIFALLVLQTPATDDDAMEVVEEEKMPCGGTLAEQVATYSATKPMTSPTRQVTTLTSKMWPADFCIDFDLTFPKKQNSNKYGYEGAVSLLGSFYISVTHTKKLLGGKGSGFGIMALEQSNGKGPYYVTEGFAKPGSKHKMQFCYKQGSNQPLWLVDGKKVAQGYLHNQGAKFPTARGVKATFLSGAHGSNIEVLKGASLNSWRIIPRPPTGPNFCKVSATPLGKVVEWLQELQKTNDKDTKEDAAAHSAFLEYYKTEKKKSEDILKSEKGKIIQLQADLKEAKALLQAKQLELVDLGQKLAKDDADLGAARTLRAKERSAWSKKELDLLESKRQLELSMEVMKKKAPASPAQSLVSIAGNLQRVLTENPDLKSLSAEERDYLSSFVQTSHQSTRRSASFLQHSLSSDDFLAAPGGVTTILQQLLTKVSAEKKVALTRENTAREAYGKLEAGLTQSLKSKKKAINDVKSIIATNQELSARSTKSLGQCQTMYAAESKNLANLNTEHSAKVKAYKARSGKRSDEKVAVTEALKVLSSEKGKTALENQAVTKKRVHKLARLTRDGLTRLVKQKTVPLLKHATTPKLALLILQSTLAAESSGKPRGRTSQKNPFKKVKTMIGGMLNKLEAEEAKESKHDAFCKGEMKKNGVSQARNKEDTVSVKAKLDTLAAEIVENTADLTEAKADLKAISAAQAAAVTMRKNEKQKAQDVIKKCDDGAATVKQACDILKKHFNIKKAASFAAVPPVGLTNAAWQAEGAIWAVKATPKATIAKAKAAPKQFDEKKEEVRRQTGQGIISMLEVAADDFVTMSKDTKKAEAAAAKSFSDMQAESNKRIAVFKKDIELNTKDETELNLKKAQLTSDLKSNNKKMTDLVTYLDKLKAACIIKAPSHAMKKAKRDQELKSLQSALDYLTKSKGAKSGLMTR